MRLARRTAKGSSPDFGNYTYGAAVTYNITRIVGIEGEVGGTAGISQNLAFGNTLISNTRTPDTLNYNANVVLSAPTGRSVVPFVTGGVGGLTMFDRAALGIDSRTTFLTGNVGAGVKWYAPSRRWGVRADYCFIGVRADNQAPAFFGRDTRYGHRVYGAVIINPLGRY
jgi:opacity protein-like surface antigen